MAEAPSSELAAEIANLEQKHAENPDGRYLVALANTYRKAGDLVRAEQLLREGLELHPDSLSAHVVLGRCLADRGAIEEAAAEFRHVLSADPQNLIALRTLGELAAAEGRSEEAEHWYGELLAVDPMNDEARAYLDGVRSEEEAESEEVNGSATNSAAGPVGDDAPAEPELPGEGQELPDFEMAEFLDLSGSSLPGEIEDALDAVLREAPAEDLGTGDVVTETIAELYARQGFYDRAAAVYRELLRRQGHDPALQARLDEMESRRAESGAAMDDAYPEADSEPREIGGAQPEAGEDPFADSFTHGFAGEAEDVPAPAAIPTISAYLGGLLAWVPRTEAAPREPENTDAGADTLGEEAAAEAGAPAFDELASGGETADEPFPWELSAPDPAAEPAEAGQPLDEESFSFDTFFAEGREPDSAPPAVASPDMDFPAESADPVAEDDGADDEDLESFQAWLRSLRR